MVREGDGDCVSAMEGADERILWVDLKRNVGIRVGVRKRELVRARPVLWSANEEDVPVSYEIEYQGKMFSKFGQ